MGVGDRVRERRESLGISQEALAAAAGTTQQSINHLEKGRVRRPGRLVEIAQALDCSPDWLLGRTEESAHAAADATDDSTGPRVYGTGPLPSTDGELDQSPEELLVTALDLHRRGLRTRAAAHARAYVEIVEQEDGPTRRRRRTA